MQQAKRIKMHKDGAKQGEESLKEIERTFCNTVEKNKIK